jgi:hypothetical protein
MNMDWTATYVAAVRMDARIMRTKNAAAVIFYSIEMMIMMMMMGIMNNQPFRKRSSEAGRTKTQPFGKRSSASEAGTAGRTKNTQKLH